MAGVLRLTGEFGRPRPQITERHSQINYMGQELNNPPSVEGWHQGAEWIDTGTLMERLNFASSQLGDTSRPGVRAMTERILAADGDVVSPEQLVDRCLDQMGAIQVTEETRSTLLQFASTLGDVGVQDDEPHEKVAQMLRVAASTPEFQRG